MDASSPAQPLHVRRDALLREIAEKHGVSVADLTVDKRPRKISDARQEWYYRAASELGLSFGSAGRAVKKSREAAFKGARVYAEREGLPIIGG